MLQKVGFWGKSRSRETKGVHAKQRGFTHVSRMFHAVSRAPLGPMEDKPFLEYKIMDVIIHTDAMNSLLMTNPTRCGHVFLVYARCGPHDESTKGNLMTSPTMNSYVVKVDISNQSISITVSRAQIS